MYKSIEIILQNTDKQMFTIYTHTHTHTYIYIYIYIYIYTCTYNNLL